MMLKASSNDTNQTSLGSPTSPDHFDAAFKNRSSHNADTTRCRRKSSEIARGDCKQAAEEEEEAAAEAAEVEHGHGHGHVSKPVTKAAPAVVPTPPSPTKPLHEFKFAVPAPRAAAIKRPSLVTGTL